MNAVSREHNQQILVELMDIDTLQPEAERISAIMADPRKPIATRLLKTYNNTEQ
jgi:hypothetical protein